MVGLLILVLVVEAVQTVERSKKHRYTGIWAVRPSWTKTWIKIHCFTRGLQLLTRCGKKKVESEKILGKIEELCKQTKPISSTVLCTSCVYGEKMGKQMSKKGAKPHKKGVWRPFSPICSFGKIRGNKVGKREEKSVSTKQLPFPRGKHWGNCGKLKKEKGGPD